MRVLVVTTVREIAGNFQEGFRPIGLAEAGTLSYIVIQAKILVVFRALSLDLESLHFGEKTFFFSYDREILNASQLSQQIYDLKKACFALTRRFKYGQEFWLWEEDR